jgi:hypothetical protein
MSNTIKPTQGSIPKTTPVEEIDVLDLEDEECDVDV